MTQRSERFEIGMNARQFPSNWRPALDEVVFAQASGFACLQFHGQEQGLAAAAP
jgi:hypothetical protein